MGLKMLPRVVSVSAPVAEAPMGVAVEVVPLEWAVSEVEGGAPHPRTNKNEARA